MNQIEQLITALRAAQVSSQICRKPLYLAQDRDGNWRPSEHPWADDAQLVVEDDTVRVYCDNCQEPAAISQNASSEPYSLHSSPPLSTLRTLAACSRSCSR